MCAVTLVLVGAAVTVPVAAAAWVDAEGLLAPQAESASTTTMATSVGSVAATRACRMLTKERRHDVINPLPVSLFALAFRRPGGHIRASVGSSLMHVAEVCRYCRS